MMDVSQVPIKYLVASTYNRINEHVQVFNKSELEYYLWIKLDVDIPSTYVLLNSYELIGGKREESITHVFIRDNPTWIKAPTELLNLLPGYHIYRLEFVETSTSNTVSLYFAYILQDDNPSKPYIYMNRD